MVDKGSLLRIGAFTICELGHTVELQGETPDGVAAGGRGELWELSDGGTLRLTVRDMKWTNGERDLVACERHSSPQRFDTLIERLRLPVTRREGELYAELRHVRLKPNGRGNLFVPDRFELDDAAGLDVVEALNDQGGRVGARRDLLGDDGPAKNRLGVRFPKTARLVPIVTYLCTRVAPVANNVRA